MLDALAQRNERFFSISKFHHLVPAYSSSGCKYAASSLKEVASNLQMRNVVHEKKLPTCSFAFLSLGADFGS